VISCDLTKVKLLAGTIRLLARAKDAGFRTPGHGIAERPRCDLCGVRLPRGGRLLVSAWGIGWATHADRDMTFNPYLAEDPLNAQYVACGTCHGLLRRDPAALLRRLLESHGVGRGN
jgi:hypothetical protein